MTCIIAKNLKLSHTGKCMQMPLNVHDCVNAAILTEMQEYQFCKIKYYSVKFDGITQTCRNKIAFNLPGAKQFSNSNFVPVMINMTNPETKLKTLSDMYAYPGYKTLKGVKSKYNKCIGFRPHPWMLCGEAMLNVVAEDKTVQDWTTPSVWKADGYPKGNENRFNYVVNAVGDNISFMDTVEIETNINVYFKCKWIFKSKMDIFQTRMVHREWTGLDPQTREKYTVILKEKSAVPLGNVTQGEINM